MAIGHSEDFGAKRAGAGDGEPFYPGKDQVSPKTTRPHVYETPGRANEHWRSAGLAHANAIGAWTVFSDTLKKHAGISFRRWVFNVRFSAMGVAGAWVHFGGIPARMARVWANSEHGLDRKRDNSDGACATFPGPSSLSATPTGRRGGRVSLPHRRRRSNRAQVFTRHRAIGRDNARSGLNTEERPAWQGAARYS